MNFLIQFVDTFTYYVTEIFVRHFEGIIVPQLQIIVPQLQIIVPQLQIL
jgi:hypothetical protein